MSLSTLLDNSSESLSYNVPVGNQGGTGGNSAGIGIAGNNESIITVNNTVTDQGAIAGALQTVGNAVSEVIAGIKGVSIDLGYINRDVTLGAIDSNERVVTDSLNRVVQAYDGAGRVVEKITGEAFAFSERALASLDDAVDAAQSSANQALYQAQSVVDLTERLNDQNTFFLSDVSKKNAELTSEVIRNSELLTGEVIRTVEDLEQMRLVESGKVIGTIKELAETVQTGGESIQQNVNKLVVYAALAMAGVIAWRALS